MSRSAAAFPTENTAIARFNWQQQAEDDVKRNLMLYVFSS
jgi:hypothetical protein